MVAYDGAGTKVNVYFDGDGEEITVSLTDEPADYASEWNEKNGILDLTPAQVVVLIEDLSAALILRGKRDLLDATFVEVVSWRTRFPVEGEEV